MSPAFTTDSPPEGEVAQDAPARENRKNKRHARKDTPYDVASRPGRNNVAKKASPPPDYHETTETNDDGRGQTVVDAPNTSQPPKSSVQVVHQRAKQPMPKTTELPIVESNGEEEKRARLQELRVKSLAKAREVKRLKKEIMQARRRKLQMAYAARRMNK